MKNSEIISTSIILYINFLQTGQLFDNIIHLPKQEIQYKLLQQYNNIFSSLTCSLHIKHSLNKFSFSSSSSSFLILIWK